ncbi:hypothetical protein BpHYR1_040271 [Brachionus plicatilis]|uniref:Uncharacterized protein n=1 Tax=Brachionus plicatilis TaxID=10195 RepID=A0A3M7R911_BRAPC|nr:hypothetical protein BpHYR1_040271 [Brachionus plicatilis]
MAAMVNDVSSIVDLSGMFSYAPSFFHSICGRGKPLASHLNSTLSLTLCCELSGRDVMTGFANTLRKAGGVRLTPASFLATHTYSPLSWRPALGMNKVPLSNMDGRLWVALGRLALHCDRRARLHLAAFGHVAEVVADVCDDKGGVAAGGRAVRVLASALVEARVRFVLTAQGGSEYEQVGAVYERVVEVERPAVFEPADARSWLARHPALKCDRVACVHYDAVRVKFDSWRLLSTSHLGH